MLGLYLAALVFGGGLLVLSIAGGHGGHDAHGHFGHGHDAHHPGSSGSDLLALFLSLRFWTFFLAFGGLTGTLLTAIGVPVAPTAAMAGGAGFALGLLAALVVRRLSSSVSSALGAEDFVGRSARVTIPVSGARNGKIRIELDGEVVDFIATTSGEEGELGVGTDVIVVEISDGVAKITRASPSRAAIAAKQAT